MRRDYSTETHKFGGREDEFATYQRKSHYDSWISGADLHCKQLLHFGLKTQSLGLSLSHQILNPGPDRLCRRCVQAEVV